jgi:hypothetical protein
MRFSNRYRRIIAVITASLFMVTASACGTTTSSGEKKVLFEVTGPATADITYGIGVDHVQDNGAKLPWKHEAASTQDPLITVITAQSKSNGDIVCKISIDGKVVKENKSSGEFAVVTCSNG